MSLTKLSENERVQTLNKYALLDTPPENHFDELTRLAAITLKAPIALISLVDKDRIWFKSHYGIEVKQVDRTPAFCASAILKKGIYEVENAKTDPRTKNDPLVTGDFGLRFYAGIPLKTATGHHLGTLCIMDTKPRKLSANEKETLKSLGRLVEQQIESRYNEKMVAYHHNQALSIFAHDLKNPLATINMAAEIIQKKKDDPKAISKMCSHIALAGKNSLRLIEDVLESSQASFGEINLKKESFNLADLVKEVVGTNRIVAKRKGQALKLYLETHCKIKADKTRITEIADNLISNALKYSENGKQVCITLWEKEKDVVLEVRDQGSGLSDQDKENLFKRFSTLSAKPTNGESSNGLGLFIAHEMAKAHKGILRAESGGKGKGSVFILELPKG